MSGTVYLLNVSSTIHYQAKLNCWILALAKEIRQYMRSNGKKYTKHCEVVQHLEKIHGPKGANCSQIPKKKYKEYPFE